jgi:hypothetical protein
VAFEHKENRGSIFRNPDKQGDNDRDYSGTANIGGRLWWISGWVRESEGGRKYLSLSFKPQNADAAQPKKSRSEDFNDSIPF